MKFQYKFFYLSFLLLSACSDVPSSNDVEDSISELFSECKLISVTSSKKTNGRALGNGNYLVNAEIELRLEPLKENTDLWEKFLNDSEVYPQIKQKQTEELAKFDNNYAPLVQKYYENGAPDELENEYEKYKQERDNFTLQQYEELEKMGFGGFDVFDKSGKSVLSKQLINFDKSCNHVQNKFASRLIWKMLRFSSSPQQQAEIMGKVENNSFAVDLEMVKTENGWQLIK